MYQFEILKYFRRVGYCGDYQDSFEEIQISSASHREIRRVPLIK